MDNGSSKVRMQIHEANTGWLWSNSCSAGWDLRYIAASRTWIKSYLQYTYYC
jgi:hypothetical protein